MQRPTEFQHTASFQFGLSIIDFRIDIFVMMSSDLSGMCSYCFTRLILPQGATCACVIYVGLTRVWG